MTNDSTTYSHNILLARTGRRRAGSSPEEIASLCQALQQEFPGDIYRQICDLYSLVAMPSATGRGPRKGREVSHKTLTRHFMAIRKFLSTLKEKNIHPKNMNEMSTKHVRIAVQAWEQQGMTAGTMSTNYSCLKRLYLLAFGKALPPIKEFLIDMASPVVEQLGGGLAKLTCSVQPFEQLQVKGLQVTGRVGSAVAVQGGGRSHALPQHVVRFDVTRGRQLELTVIGLAACHPTSLWQEIAGFNFEAA